MKPLLMMALLVCCVAAWADGEGPARSELERFSTGLQDLQVDFTQVVKSQDGTIKDQTHGNAWMQSPDKLRWVYSGDFPETIVADGRNVWIHDEALQQVMIKPQSANISDAPLLILTDISQLDTQFQVTELGAFEDLHLLELKSNDAESEFERILLGMDPCGVRLMIMEDAFGQRTEIHFENIIRNAGIDPRLFSFTPPDDADVVGEISPPE